MKYSTVHPSGDRQQPVEQTVTDVPSSVLGRGTLMCM